MFLEKIKNNFIKYKNNEAFVINELIYTYKDFSEKIISIQQSLLSKINKNDVVVIHTYNDLETYASIFAVWFSGGTFVPVNPNHPKDRNDLILNQVDYKLILSSKENTKNLEKINSEIQIKTGDLGRIMYVLFTSGSTGIPKGVAISLHNISSFITEFSSDYKLDNKDKFLQIYDLTFDASIHNYLLPIYLGASVFTVNPQKIKYLEAYKLMDKYQLTFSKMPPSVIAYLKPFFNKINLPNLRYSLFGGESLNYELVKLWKKCVPNAEIHNVYGPTEATINTHIFKIDDKLSINKTYNGTVAIGKPFGTNKAIIIDENNTVLPMNTKGELCLYGNQITPGYLKNKEKNKTSFFYKGNDKIYKTGDLAYIDNDGDFIFCGRIDNQVQIQGYRVELSEIENTARQYENAVNYAVVSLKNKLEVDEIVLFIEILKTDTNSVKEFLKQRLPNYMLPSKIIDLEKFPISSSGKIDKQKMILDYIK